MANRFVIVERVLGEEMALPYDPGKADCFFLGCRMADALGRSKLAELYAGTYQTLLGAQRALRKHGFRTLSDLFGSHFERCAPAQARMGDLVVLKLNDGEHVGVCLGTRFVTKTSRGRSDHSVDECVTAFRV